MSIRHTLHELPPRMRGRSDAVDSAVRQFLTRVSVAVNRGMVERLSGSGAPGGYPVPRRSNDGLRARAGMDAPRRGGAGWQAVVFNEAPYARAVHEGFHAYGNPNAPYYGPRRFLSDAADAVDTLAEFQRAMERIP